MSKNLNITGRDQVLKNLDKAIRSVIGGTERGLVRTAILIKNEAVKLAPRDTGNLRASCYIVSRKGVIDSGATNFSNARGDAGKQAGNMASALSDARARVFGVYQKTEIGFATTYAAAVHEHTQVPHAVGQAKYLEDAVKSNTARILDIIKRDAWSL